jgi:hypothetical protein
MNSIIVFTSFIAITRSTSIPIKLLDYQYWLNTTKVV